MADEEEEDWWEGPSGPPPLWNDEEERARLLEAVGKDKERDERVAALLELRGKGMDSNNREELWADAEVRAVIIDCARGPDPDAPKKSLYNEGPEIPDEGVRMVALSCMAQLSQSSVCRRDMALDPKCCEAILMGVDKFHAAEEEQSFELRHRAWITLTGVCLAGTCTRDAWREPPGGGSDVLDGMLQGFKSEVPEVVRAGVLGTVWSLACNTDVDPVALWKYKPLRKAVVDCARPGEPPEVRENALGLMWAVATHDDNREAMWSDDAVREVLLESAPPEYTPKEVVDEDEEVDELEAALAGLSDDEGDKQQEDEEEEEELAEEQEEEEIELLPQTAPVREKALCALSCLAAEKCLKEAMWSDPQLGPVLLECAGLEQSPVVRAASIRTLLQLGTCYENQWAMFGAGVPQLLTTAADDKSLPLTREERNSCIISTGRINEGAEWAAMLAAEAAAEEEARKAAEALREAAEAEAAAQAAAEAEAAAEAAAGIAADEDATAAHDGPSTVSGNEAGR